MRSGPRDWLPNSTPSAAREQSPSEPREKAYLKSELTHYGASVPAMRAAVRAAMAGITLGHDELVALVDALWAEPVHERRAAAIEVLETRRSLPGAGSGPSSPNPTPTP